MLVSDVWVPTINNKVIAVLIAANIIYISSSLGSFANDNHTTPQLHCHGRSHVRTQAVVCK
jgi:Flp pilus assembly protein protease CpaA